MSLTLSLVADAVGIGCWWFARQAYLAGNVAGTVYWMGLTLSCSVAALARSKRR